MEGALQSAESKSEERPLLVLISQLAQAGIQGSKPEGSARFVDVLGMTEGHCRDGSVYPRGSGSLRPQRRSRGRRAHRVGCAGRVRSAAPQPRGEQLRAFPRHGGGRVEIVSDGYRNYESDWEPARWVAGEGGIDMFRNWKAPDSVLQAFPGAGAAAVLTPDNENLSLVVGVS
jgi:hypothetical protein